MKALIAAVLLAIPSASLAVELGGGATLPQGSTQTAAGLAVDCVRVPAAGSPVWQLGCGTNQGYTTGSFTASSVTANGNGFLGVNGAEYKQGDSTNSQAVWLRTLSGSGGFYLYEGSTGANRVQLWADQKSSFGIGLANASTFSYVTNGEAAFQTKSIKVSSGVLTVDGTGAAANIVGSTLTVANSGIISMPSQSGASVSRANTTMVIPNSVFTEVFWDSTNVNHQFTFDQTNSSGTLKARGAGSYSFGCSVLFQQNNTGERGMIVTRNGSTIATIYGMPVTVAAGGDATGLHVSGWWNASDGDTFKCFVLQNSGGDLNLLTGSNFFLRKDQ